MLTQMGIARQVLERMLALAARVALLAVILSAVSVAAMLGVSLLGDGFPLVHVVPQLSHFLAVASCDPSSVSCGGAAPGPCP